MKNLICSTGDIVVSNAFTSASTISNTYAYNLQMEALHQTPQFQHRVTAYRQVDKRLKPSDPNPEPNKHEVVFKKQNPVEILDVACVYLLLRRGKVVYVGQSKNIYSRIQNHRRAKDFTHFRILRCHPARLNYWEGKLIFDYKPEYNKRGVESREGVVVPFGTHTGSNRKLKNNNHAR